MSVPPLRELDAETFAATVTEPMRDVTRNPHAAVDLDLWAYAEPALERHFAGQPTGRWDVLLVMQNAVGTYQHVLIGPRRGKARLVLVIDLEAGEIAGHVEPSSLDRNTLGTIDGAPSRPHGLSSRAGSEDP